MYFHVYSRYGGIPGISDAECLKSLRGSLLQTILYRLVISTLHSIGLVFLVHYITPRPLRYVIIFCDVGFFFYLKWGLGHTLPQWHFIVWSWEDSLMTEESFAAAELAGLALKDPAGQRQPNQAQINYSPKFIWDLHLRKVVVSFQAELSNTLINMRCS